MSDRCDRMTDEEIRRQAAVVDLREEVARVKAAERARIEVYGDGCCTAGDELESYLDGYDNGVDDLLAAGLLQPLPAQDEKRCSHHQCALVEYKPGWWDCPLASLEDLTDHFQRLYETVYVPAPAGEDGIYHRAREIVAALRGVPVEPKEREETK